VPEQPDELVTAEALRVARAQRQYRRLAHWCTILVSVIFDGSLMHPWCRQVIALLA
jgi:hypothetical protein